MRLRGDNSDVHIIRNLIAFGLILHVRAHKIRRIVFANIACEKMIFSK